MVLKLHLLLLICELSILAAAAGPRVDLGYAIYEGRYNATSKLNIFKGYVRRPIHCVVVLVVVILILSRIRYAAPPTGKNRWQAPIAPDINRDTVLPALGYTHCPYTFTAPFTGNNFTKPPLDRNALLADPYFKTRVQGNEDCLFLNVYAPANAKDLPILVWIHGGGYGISDGSWDLSDIINANGNGFIGVGIEYRVCHLLRFYSRFSFLFRPKT